MVFDILKLWILLSYFLIANADKLADRSLGRKLSYYFNPGCTPEYAIYCANGSQLNLIYITADNSEDSLHYLWSTWKLPTVIIAKTSPDATLHVNWTDLYNFGSNAISFSETPAYSIGFVVKEIWEFTDSDDKVDMNLYPNHTKPLNLTTLDWGDVNTTVKITENLITAFPKSSNSETPFSDKGSFAVKFSTTGEESVSEEYPRLIFTGNSTQVQLVLDDLITENKKSRFAVELVALSSNAPEHKKWHTVPKKSISDEFSPGVFRFLQLKTPCAPSADYCEGFVSWKPVAYIGAKPTVANSSDATVSLLNTNMSTFSISDSIATSFFGQYTNVSEVLFYVTFGTSGDGFYSKTKYTSWTLMMGVGESISQGLSKTAILAISIGLGVPLALMFVATIYLVVMQCRKKDDELLLSQDSMN